MTNDSEKLYPPDLDFCSRCREHTDFDWDEDDEIWLSVCCGTEPVDMGD